MPASLSTHARIVRTIPTVMKGRKEITLTSLKTQLESKLHVRLRIDYLVCNLLGQPGYFIDCETKSVFRIK